MHFSNHALNF